MPYAPFENEGTIHGRCGGEITNGGSGIGAAVVRRLVSRGVRCLVDYATSRDEAEAIAAEVAGPAMSLLKRESRDHR